MYYRSYQPYRRPPRFCAHPWLSGGSNGCLWKLKEWKYIKAEICLESPNAPNMATSAIALKEQGNKLSRLPLLPEFYCLIRRRAFRSGDFKAAEELYSKAFVSHCHYISDSDAPQHPTRSYQPLPLHQPCFHANKAAIMGRLPRRLHQSHRAPAGKHERLLLSRPSATRPPPSQRGAKLGSDRLSDMSCYPRF